MNIRREFRLRYGVNKEDRFIFQLESYLVVDYDVCDFMLRCQRGIAVSIKFYFSRAFGLYLRVLIYFAQNSSCFCYVRLIGIDLLHLKGLLGNMLSIYILNGSLFILRTYQ